MIPTRALRRNALPRATRAVRAPRAQQLRLQSTTTSSSSSTGNAATGSSTHYLSGAVGGLAAGGLLYGIYYVSPAGKVSRTINATSKQAQQKYNAATAKLQESTPDPDQTISYLKDLCYSYVAWIPGGKGFIDSAFTDIDKVRRNHKDEADALLKDAYGRFQKLSKEGSLSLDTARRGLEILADVGKMLADLGADALGDIVDEHPELKDKLGGSVDQLKQYGEQYGPEAKKQVNETWRKLADIVKGGLSVESVKNAKDLLQEKTEQLQKLGEEAWSKGLEQAKPLLDKNPKIKELIEKNADVLKKGNAKELFERASKAASSGDLGDLEGYVNGAVEKAKSKGSQLSGGSLEQYFNQIPNASEILPKLQQLKEVSEKHTEESKKLVEETIQELKKVLESKSEEAKKILDQAQKESK